MKISQLICASSACLVSSASAFSFSSVAKKQKPTATSARSHPPRPSTQLYQFAQAQQGGLVNLEDIYSPRDVYSMEEWATQYGMQKADGVEMYVNDGGVDDYGLMTNSGASAGQTVVCVPADIVISSASAQQEFGQSLQQAENTIIQIDQRAQAGSQYRLPLFRLMVKILAEWEKGSDSMYYPWLNSLPRQFYNGVSMTKACDRCLPPYAGWLTMTERTNYAHFFRALRQRFVPLQESTITNRVVVKWAYNVALTRFHEVWQPERAKIIGPVADMLNHAAEPNCAIDVDYEGNVNVQALYDIAPGSPLTVSLGDPTNPTPIFAQYGFLPQDCATIFCKAMHLEPQIQELGYEFQELLFQTETGEIAPKVWDIFLYSILQQNDPGTAQQFSMACQTNDEGTKEQYHAEYYAYTLDALKQHVYGILADCENLTMMAQSYDQTMHPRVPVIVAHNTLVSQTFTMTASLLEQM